MARIKVYDTEGNEHSKEPIDARECVNVLGWTKAPVEKEVQVVRTPQKAQRKAKEVVVAEEVKVDTKDTKESKEV